MKKAPEAFRTISEVSEILETPAHVLRFWESKFYQIRPVKRAGGRRYYRPDDVALINGIRVLLQDQGMTIRGVQRVLQEQGVKHVTGLSGKLPLGDPEDGVIDAEIIEDSAPAISADPGTPMPEEAVAARETVAPTGAVEDHPAIQADEPTVEVAALEAAAQAASSADRPEAPAGPDALESAAPEKSEPALVTSEAADTDRAAPSPPSDTLAGDHQDATATDARDEISDPISLSGSEQRMTEDDSAPAAAAVAVDGPPMDMAIQRGTLPDTARQTAPDTIEPPAPAMQAQQTDQLRIAKRLRAMRRGELGPKGDAVALMARRIDTLLDRMSEASGAGRW